jgi:hypothetical protein
MATVVASSRPGDTVLVVEYANDDTQLTLWDEPVLAWLIDDATGAETPVIPGTLPAPTVPDPDSKPAWVNLLPTAEVPVVIYPDHWRGGLQEFLDWLSQGGRLLRGSGIAAPFLQSQWAWWAQNNPDKVW